MLPRMARSSRRVRPTTEFPYTAVHVNGPAFVPLIAGPGQSGGLLGQDTDPLVLGRRLQSPGGRHRLTPEPELPTIRLSARRTLLESIDQFRQRPGRSGQIDDTSRSVRPGVSPARFAPIARCLRFDSGKSNRCAIATVAIARARRACSRAARRGRNSLGDGLLQPQRARPGFGSTRFRSLRLGHAQRHFRGDEKLSHAAIRSHVSPPCWKISRSADCWRPLWSSEWESSAAHPELRSRRGFAGTTPGRKHWASVYSIVMAGAGIQPGQSLRSLRSTGRLSAVATDRPVGRGRDDVFRARHRSRDAVSRRPRPSLRDQHRPAHRGPLLNAADKILENRRKCISLKLLTNVLSMILDD